MMNIYKNSHIVERLSDVNYSEMCSLNKLFNQSVDDLKNSNTEFFSDDIFMFALTYAALSNNLIKYYKDNQKDPTWTMFNNDMKTKMHQMVNTIGEIYNDRINKAFFNPSRTTDYVSLDLSYLKDRRDLYFVILYAKLNGFNAELPKSDDNHIFDPNLIDTKDIRFIPGEKMDLDKTHMDFIENLHFIMLDQNQR